MVGLTDIMLFKSLWVVSLTVNITFNTLYIRQLQYHILYVLEEMPASVQPPRKPTIIRSGRRAPSSQASSDTESLVSKVVIHFYATNTCVTH